MTYENEVRRASVHMLYTKWAVRHLLLIDHIQELLGNQANFNLMDLQEAVLSERQKLVQNKAAYKDAQEILDEIEKIRKIKEGVNASA